MTLQMAVLLKDVEEQAIFMYPREKRKLKEKNEGKQILEILRI